MDVNPISPRIIKIWGEWNIRGAVLFSLFLQVLLVLFASVRKRTGRKTIILLIWSAYLLADAVANFAIGLIVKSQGSHSDHSSLANSKDNSDLLAFWAPFLLVHLGGPDTITAFSLEDNQLWLRHLLSFGVQSVVTGYVFFLTLPSNKLIVPTSLLFLAGFIKYLERTCSLYLASKEKFRDSLLRKPEPGVDYAGLMDVYGSRIPDPLVTRQSSVRTNNVSDVLSNQVVPEEVGLVLRAYGCFSLLRGLIVDLPIRATDYEAIHNLWRDMEGEGTFRMIEVELNFFYEVLYTKAVVVHSPLGMCCRSTSLVSVIVALFVFHVLAKKNGNFDGIDVRVTYALLYGALALDALALVRAFFSDWTVTRVLQINLDKTCCPGLVSLLCENVVSLFSKLLGIRRPQTDVDRRGLHVLAAPCVFRRWSEYVSGFNLIRFCLKRRPRTPRVKNCSCIQLFLVKIKATINLTRVDKVVICCYRIVRLAVKRALRFAQVYKARPRVITLWNNLVEWVGLRDLLNELKYKSREPLTVELWEFILQELQTKSEQRNPETIINARGEWAIQNHFKDEYYTELMSYIVDVAFDESLLLWHIATELLYKGKKVYHGDNIYKDRYISKTLSDYMLYLLIMRPTMMEAVSSSDQILRFQDTCEEAERFFKRIGIRSTQVKTACKKTLGLKMEITPKELKGEEESMAVFFEANMLAKELMKLKEKKWKVMSKVWVEMLSYAASHCSSRAHAQEISKGGELITFVWLVMAHYGLIRKQFQKRRL